MYFETTRLTISDPEVEDWQGAHNFLSDPQVMRWIHLGPAPFSEAQSRQWIADLMFHNRQQPRRAHNSLIRLRTTGQIIGWIGIGIPNREGIGDLDFGYALHRDYWGQGYMTEAIRGLIRFAFDELDASRVYAECDERNVGSARVMEKAGMEFTEHFRNADGDLMRRYVISKTPSS